MTVKCLTTVDILEQYGVFLIYSLFLGILQPESPLEGKYLVIMLGLLFRRKKAQLKVLIAAHVAGDCHLPQ